MDGKWSGGYGLLWRGFYFRRWKKRSRLPTWEMVEGEKLSAETGVAATVTEKKEDSGEVLGREEATEWEDENEVSVEEES